MNIQAIPPQFSSILYCFYCCVFPRSLIHFICDICDMKKRMILSNSSFLSFRETIIYTKFMFNSSLSRRINPKRVFLFPVMTVELRSDCCLLYCCCCCFFCSHSLSPSPEFLSIRQHIFDLSMTFLLFCDVDLHECCYTIKNCIQKFAVCKGNANENIYIEFNFVEGERKICTDTQHTHTYIYLSISKRTNRLQG